MAAMIKLFILLCHFWLGGLTDLSDTIHPFLRQIPLARKLLNDNVKAESERIRQNRINKEQINKKNN